MTKDLLEVAQDAMEKSLIETIAEGVAPHLTMGVFDYLISELIELGAIQANLAEYALEYYGKITEGEDIN